MADRVTAKMRRAVAERARGYCEYCRCPDCFSPQPFSIDHTLPKSRGGRTEFENLALICQGCNNHKYDKIEGLDPKSQARVNLYNPRQGLGSASDSRRSAMAGLRDMGDRAVFRCRYLA
jgi:5-methylcytosine-specific restriction endonuclease McrA